MPFLRVARDKRGVETTALLHTSRGHGKGKPRVLYWFRTPPDIRFGRAPIDEAAIAELEQAHPDVTFDWPRILDASRSLATAGARRARDERVGQAAPRRKKRRGTPSQPEQHETAAPVAAQPGEPTAAATVTSPAQVPARRRRSRRGGSRHRRKGGAVTPPEANS